jgi:hypothetical protein
LGTRADSVIGFRVSLQDANGTRCLPWLFPTRPEARKALAAALQESHADGGRVVEERIELQVPMALPVAAASETDSNATPAPDGPPLYEIGVPATGERTAASSPEELLTVIRTLVERDPNVVVNVVLHIPAPAAAPQPQAARVRSVREGGARE